MGYKQLPGYHPSVRVSAATARQDKINLALGDWRVGVGCNPRHQYDQDYAAFLLLLTPSGPSSFLPRSAASRPITDWFTRAESRYGSAYPTLTIRQGGRGRGLGAGSPLVKGKLLTRRVWQPPTSEGQRRRSELQVTLKSQSEPDAVRTPSVTEWMGGAAPCPSQYVGIAGRNLGGGVASVERSRRIFPGRQR